jgi:hypothetical protein
MWLRLFVPRPVGLADNGDGIRMMCHFRVAPRPDDGGGYFDYAVLDYHVAPQVANACNPYPTSTRLLMQAAQRVSEGLGLQAQIDLRIVMVIYCLVAGVAVALFARVVSGGWMRQAVAAAAFWLVAADSAFATYPGSAFTETAGLMAMLLLAPAAVALARSGVGNRARVGAAFIFGGAGALTVGAKVPFVTSAVPMVAFLLWIVVRRGREPGRPARVPRRRDVLVRLAAGGAVVGILASGFVTYRDNPKDFGIINVTDTLFASVLAHGDDPAADLAEMQLPTALARYAGRSWWHEDPPQNDPAFGRAADRLTYSTIAEFLARHPGRAIEIADAGAQEYMSARPPYLGNYLEGAAPARTLECRVCLLSQPMSNNHGLGLVGYGFGALVLTAGAWWLLRARGSGSISHSFAVAGLLMLVINAVQFVTATYGEGIETTKHLVLAILAGFLAVLLLAVSAVTRFAEPGA